MFASKKTKEQYLQLQYPVACFNGQENIAFCWQELDLGA
jgi:hypothetical protein